jgi:hypothetical protein
VKILLIIDGESITRWQAKALDSLTDVTTIAAISCKNTKTRRRVVRNALYYLLNSVSVRNRWTRRVSISKLKTNFSKIKSFYCAYDGAWQVLPADVEAWINDFEPDAIVKFGMSLLRVPTGISSPILSYHHGDPSAYRGRPAGFWETLHGRPTVGQVVQVITNKLDAGAIAARAETKVYLHSYRATLVEAYRHSPLLLGKALTNAISGQTFVPDKHGPNFRLPDNRTVFTFALRMVGACMRRLLYGAFYEKIWCVGTVRAAISQIIDGQVFPAFARWNTFPRSPDHLFHADPFFSHVPPGVLVEAMNRRSGKGQLIFIGDDQQQRSLTPPGRHYSYPATVSENGKTYVVPEIAQWSPPHVYELTDRGLFPVQPLRIDANERIVDPTIYQAADGVYLFGNRKTVGANALFLWHSDTLFGPFVEHVASPIMISPAGGRMAGNIVSLGSQLYRLGQDGRGEYGDGVTIFRIRRLTRTSYEEARHSEVRFTGVSGPHTLNFADGVALFDWYADSFHALSWLRRLRSRTSRSRQRIYYSTEVVETTDAGNHASMRATPELQTTSL